MSVRASSRSGDFRAVRVRAAMLALLAGGCLWLALWTGYLARTLPAQHDTYEWRLAWVGFDAALLCCFALSTWLGWRRSRAAVPALIATGTLMCCDAWFDVVLDWDGPDRWTSLAMAVLVELPVAGWLLMRARRLLVGPVVPRVVTMREIDEVITDLRCQAVMRVLAAGEPVGDVEVAAALRMRPDEVSGCLDALARHGHIRRDRAGRWRVLPLNLHMPEPAEVDPADRERYRSFLDAKYERELSMFARAARYRDELGGWGKGSRGAAYLTEEELARFNDEYMELLLRYSLLHERPGPRVREVALRFYAFPQSLAEEDPPLGTAVPAGNRAA